MSLCVLLIGKEIVIDSATQGCVPSVRVKIQDISSMSNRNTLVKLLSIFTIPETAI